MLTRIKKRIKKYIELLEKQEIELPKTPVAIVFLAADYGNIGDVAITLAQEEFIKKQLGTKYSVLKIGMNDTYKKASSIKKQLKEGDLITIIGGGNFGNLYYDYQLRREYIVKKFRDYKIVSFPQSVFFEDKWYSFIDKARSKKIFNNAKRLTIFARDSISLKKLNEMYKTDNRLCPDIVLSREKNKNVDRNHNDRNAICLIRNDKESSSKRQSIEDIEETLRALGFKVEKTDTVVAQDNFDGKELFDNKLKEISKHKIAITDRLHGMIFCYLTSTPCIVLKNNNAKIESLYNDWLSEVPYIKLVDKVEKSAINEVLRADTGYMIEDNFKDLREAVGCIEK